MPQLWKITAAFFLYEILLKVFTHYFSYSAINKTQNYTCPKGCAKASNRCRPHKALITKENSPRVTIVIGRDKTFSIGFIVRLTSEKIIAIAIKALGFEK